MNEFFSAMSGFEKTLWMIATPTTLIFIFQVITIFLGIDGDSDTDIDTDIDDGDDGHSFGWFSFKNLINFFVIFAWTGIVCVDHNLSTFLATVLSTIAGISFVIFMAFLMYSFSKLAEDGTPTLSDLIGTVGTVYLTIPDSSSGESGKINIVHGGSMKVLDAISESERIPTGCKIIVSNLLGNTIVVKKV